MINEHISSSLKIHSWIESKLDGIDIPKNSRSLISVLCFDVVIEHHYATLCLIREKIYGSAFTLARPLFETFVRGVWIKNCATDGEIESYKNDKFSNKFGEIVKDIEGIEAFKSGALSSLKKNGWDAMCSYTHGGILQISRRFNNSEILPDYIEEEVVEVIKLAQSFALLSVIQIAAEINKVDLANEALELLHKFEIFKKE